MQPKKVTRLRGMVKLVLFAVIIQQILTSLFAYAARLIDPSVPPEAITIFGLATSLVVGFWLQSDARNAYRFATEKGFVTPVDEAHPMLRIKDGCPRKWLVILHIELNPTLVGM
jgi:hypothetical protein